MTKRTILERFVWVAYVYELNEAQREIAYAIYESVTKRS